MCSNKCIICGKDVYLSKYNVWFMDTDDVERLCSQTCLHEHLDRKNYLTNVPSKAVHDYIEEVI